MLKIGEILYPKKFKTAPEPGMAEGVLYKGHLITLLIGYVQEGGNTPNLNDIQALLGNAGYVKFDDVVECLGKKDCDKLIFHVTNKYQKNAKT